MSGAGFEICELLLALGGCALAKDGGGQSVVQRAEAADTSANESYDPGYEPHTEEDATARKAKCVALLEEAAVIRWPLALYPWPP